MPCCVVMNGQSSEAPDGDLGDDKPTSAIATTCSQSIHNQSQSMSPSRTSPEECQSAADNPSSKTINSPFMEPWSKIMAQAKSKGRRSKSREIQSVEVKICGPTQEQEQLNVADTKLVQTSIQFTEKHKTTPKQNGHATLQTSERRMSLRQSSRKAKEPSLVELDCCDNKLDSSTLQKRRKKSPESVKQTPSVGSKFCDSDDDSEDCLSTDSTSSTKECLICNKTFARPWRLRVHLYRHINIEGPYTCDFKGCSKTYFAKSHLDRHKATSHAEKVITLQFKCPEKDCQKLFVTGSGLKRHINKIHSGEKLKFKCNQCDKSFSKNKQLRYHTAEHTGQPPLKCTKCDVGVYTDNQLKLHMRSHKEYPCDVPGCELVFNNISTFKTHKDSHNKCFNSLECAHCKRKFTTKFNLREHVMTHLKDKKVFQCTYDNCERVYYQEKNLRSHIRVRHLKKTNFECPWSDCEMYFLSKRALWKHVSVHENGIAPPVRKKETRAPRKDKGQPKRAMATILAGMMVPPQVEKQLLKDSSTPKLSESESEESLGQSKVDIPLLIAGSSVERDISENTENIMHHIDDEPITDNTQSSVLVDNSIIENFTGRVFEVNHGGMLMEVCLTENISNQLNGDQTAAATEAQVQSSDDLQPKDGIIEHISEINPARTDMPGEKVHTLSATLCAETIVECSSTEKDREVLLLIPKAGQSTNVGSSAVNSNAVVEALSGNVDVYSVAEGVSTPVSKIDQQLENHQTEQQGIVRRVSLTDSSVTSILQPLIEKLGQLPKEKIEDIVKVSFLTRNGPNESCNTFTEMDGINISSDTSLVLLEGKRAEAENTKNEANSLDQQSSSFLHNENQHCTVPVKVSGSCPDEETGDSSVPDEETGDSSVPDEEDDDGEDPDEGAEDGEDPDKGAEGGEDPDEGAEDGEDPDEGAEDGEDPDEEAEDGEIPNEENEDGSVSDVEAAEDSDKEGEESAVSDRKASDTGVSNHKTLKCSSPCSSCSTFTLDISGTAKEKITAVNKTSTTLSNKSPSLGGKLKVRSVDVGAINDSPRSTSVIDEISNAGNAETRRDQSMLLQRKTRQNSFKRKLKGTNNKGQTEKKDVFDSSDSEPVNDKLRKHTQSTVTLVASNDNLSDASISSCFESPKRKRRKPSTFTEIDSELGDSHFNPKYKKRKKCPKIISSDSESESSVRVAEKPNFSPLKSATKRSVLTYPGKRKPPSNKTFLLPALQDPTISSVEEENPSQPTLSLPKSSGAACRQLSESTWLDILREVNKNVKVTMSANSLQIDFSQRV